MKVPIQIIAILLVLSLVAGRAQAVFLESISSEPTASPTPLESVGAIAVLVEDPREDARKAGLSREALKNYIELRLRRSNIPVRDVSVTTKESPCLYLNVNVTYLNDIDHYIFRTELSLRQRVMLLRNGKFIQAATWDNAMHGVSKSGRITGSVTSTIDQLLDIFIRLYLQANPKKGEQ